MRLTGDCFAKQDDVTDPAAVFVSRDASRLTRWQRYLLAWTIRDLLGVPIARAELMAYTPFFDLTALLMTRAGGVNLPPHALFREISRLRVTKEHGRREPALAVDDLNRLHTAKAACRQIAAAHDPQGRLLRGVRSDSAATPPRRVA